MFMIISPSIQSSLRSTLGPSGRPCGDGFHYAMTGSTDDLAHPRKRGTKACGFHLKISGPWSKNGGRRIQEVCSDGIDTISGNVVLWAEFTLAKKLCYRGACLNASVRHRGPLLIEKLSLTEKLFFARRP